MPEYSSTTITPADAVQIPAMNGSTSGNFTMSSAKGYMLDSKGQANGLASLDANGKLTESEIPTLVTNQISKMQKQIDNINEKEGDYTVTTYSDAPYGVVPSSKAEYAGLTTIRGVTRSWNQLLKPSTFLASTTFDNGNLTYTNNGDGSITLQSSTTLSASVEIALVGVTSAMGAVSGHDYFLFGGATNINFGTANGTANICNGSGAVGTITFNSSISMGYKIPLGTDLTTAVTLWPQLVDLTRLGASDTSSVATVLAQFPQLAQYNSYDAGSLVSTTISAVVSKSRNVWDMVWEIGGIDDSTGGDVITNAQFRSVNYIPVLPSQAYYNYAASSASMYVYYYDSDKNFIGRAMVNGAYDIASATITTPSNCFYIRFKVQPVGITTYDKTKVCINLSDSQNGTYTAYWSPVTLSLPTPFTGHSAGSVADIKYVETGVVARKVGNVNLGDLNWDYDSNATTPLFYSDTLSDSLNFPSNSYDGYEGVCSEYSCVTYAVWSSSGKNKDLAYCRNGYSSSKRIYLVNKSKTASDLTDGHADWLEGVYLNYALATPYTDPATPTPLTDYLVKTEAGGTLTPTQTQTPTIDVNFDMEYLTV